MDWTVLLPYAKDLGNTGFALWLGQATWRIAGLLTIHLFGLTLLLGAVLVSSLRLIGLFLRDRPIAEVRRVTGPVAITGLVIMVASGALIFTGGAEAYYTGYWFRLKMVLLVIAITFHFTIARAVAYAQTGRLPAVVNALTGLVGLLLWFGVGWAGRAIAFF
jgi:hypothetical protein